MLSRKTTTEAVPVLPAASTHVTVMTFGPSFSDTELPLDGVQFAGLGTV